MIPTTTSRLLLLGLFGLLACAGAATAQAPLVPAAATRYDVVALRVEFQPDTTQFTTGDGTFGGDLYGGLEPNVDPLPHDAAYFEAHLQFLENYVARASDGQTRIETHLIPEVVRLSQPMGAYSPVGPNADAPEQLAKLAGLVAEAWATASGASGFDLSGFDPQTTAFVLFHAGVGRDIELTNTTLDRTPEDLPSRFFGGDALRELLGPAAGAITFNGFPVGHTILVPRTETRRGIDPFTEEPFLIELSINGLLAASFFNYLGVPDLFDTATGEAAIGAYGLMDPQGFFAYAGLFAPEPSAWTKLALGWATVREAPPPETVALTAMGVLGATEAARVPITRSEYFLVENRQRDLAANGPGETLTVWQRGALVEQPLSNADSLFTAFTTEGFVGGVVVDASNFDWALPGGLDSEGEARDGGLVIWHVDENRIRAGLATNTVNADPERRGLDVEEADGAQDLGFPTQGLFGPQGGEATAFDYWYAGNPAAAIVQSGATVRLYENRFGPDTYPSTTTNADGPSFLVLDDFSEPGPVMTFEVHAADAVAGVEPLGGFEAPTLSRTGAGAFLMPARTTGLGEQVVLFPAAETADDYFIYRLFQVIAATGEVAHVTASPYEVLVAQGEQDLLTTVVHTPERDDLVLDQDVPLGGEDLLRVYPSPPELVGLAGPLVVSGDASAYGARAITEAGRGLLIVDESEARLSRSSGVLGVAVLSGEVLAITADAVETLAGEARWHGLGLSGPVGQPAFGRDASGLVGVVPDTTAGELLWLLADGTTRPVGLDRIVLTPNPPSEITNPQSNAFPVLADLDADGRLDALTTVGRWLVAFTQGGAVVDGFPIRLETETVAQPLVAELTDSGAWSVLVAGLDGYLYAYDLGGGEAGRAGDPVPGFPLAVGGRVVATPLVHEGRLYAVSEAGTLRAWQLDGAGAVWWGQLYHDPQHTSFVELGPAPAPIASGDLLVADETYNWPNPVADGQTYLRVATTADARITATITDLAGSLVDEVVIGDVAAGVPVEVLWRTAAPSGVYFARVTATAPDGRTETRLIKMAVVR